MRGVKLHTSAYKAVQSYGVDAGQDWRKLRDKLTERGLLRMFWARDLPNSVRQGRTGWDSLWLLVTDNLWYAVNSDDERGPYGTKKLTLRKIGHDTSSYVDTGLYEAGSWMVGRRGVLIEYGLLDPEEVWFDSS